MDYVKRIHDLQTEFVNDLRRDGSTIDYDHAVVSACDKLMRDLPKDKTIWPVIEPTSTIDMYYECLYYVFMLTNDLPIDLLVRLMEYRPFVYNIIMTQLQYDEIDRFHEQIKSILGDRDSILRERMNMNIHPDDMSTLSYCHYLIGFTWSDKSLEPNTLLINITYKDINPDPSIYWKSLHIGNDKVNDLPKYGKEFLTPALVDAFKPVDKIHSDTISRFNLWDGTKITDPQFMSEPIHVALHYGDGYVRVMDQDLTIEQANRFIRGALPRLLPTSEYLNYARNDYYANVGEVLSYASSESSSMTISEFTQSYLRVYMNDDTSHLDKKWLNWLKDKLPDGPEKDLFLFYLSLYDYSEFNYVDYIAYVKAYLELE